MTRVEDLESGGSDARSERKERFASRGFLVVGLFVACGLIVALLFGFMVGVKSSRRNARNGEEKACNKIRDQVTNWAFFLSSRAFVIGTSTSTTQTHLPFLMPNEDVYKGVAAGVMYIDEMRASTSGRDFYGSPSILWHPAVEDADRETYESFMSSVVGFNVTIQDGQYQGDESFGWTESVPSPVRPMYYPLSTVWGPLAAPLALDMMKKVVGDNAYSQEKKWPHALLSRLFDERKPTAHASYDASGNSITDDGIVFTVPYCGVQGCDAANATILGLISHLTVADDWDPLFPDHVEITALDGEAVKSVDASRYSANVVAQEKYLDLEIRCYYEKQSVFQTDALPYLWLGAIALLVSIVGLVTMYFVDVRTQHTRMRSAWAATQHRILNAMPDAVVSMTFTTDCEPTMVVLNQACDHGFHGMASAIALSDVVSTDDLARVRALFKDPSARSIDFESRFLGSERAVITYEVSISPLVRSGSKSHERVCVFRDVSLRVQREEDSRQAALLLAQAEESLSAEALKSAEQRLRDNVKTETYLSHELKNRIIVLLDSLRCARSDFDDVPHSPLTDAHRARLAEITNIAEDLLATTKLKSVLLHLATGVYDARLEDTNLSKLLETRLARYLGAGLNLTSVPTVGNAVARGTSLTLDPMLINIVTDNLLSNALKYGDAHLPPSVALRIEPVEDGVVSVSLTVCNAAGPDHERLLQLGEAELNLVAAREGARAHGQLGAATSSGDGFPMAIASAHALGGALRLALSHSKVRATLSLPRVKFQPAARFGGATDISKLSLALVDDSVIVRKMLMRKIQKAFSSRETLIVAGETHASIESFPRMVVDADTDVLFVDQNFGDIHQTKVGTDLVREIRAIDLDAGNARRLIFVVSANDAPDDIKLYRAAGADGHVSKSTSVDSLRVQVCLLANDSDRFRGRVTPTIENRTLENTDTHSACRLAG